MLSLVYVASVIRWWKTVNISLRKQSNDYWFEEGIIFVGKMDPEAFLDLANQVAKLKMYPYFELAHAAVVCLTIKEDMGSGNQYLNLPFKANIIMFISIIGHNHIKICPFFLFQVPKHFLENIHYLAGFQQCSPFLLEASWPIYCSASLA